MWYIVLMAGSAIKQTQNSRDDLEGLPSTIDLNDPSLLEKFAQVSKRDQQILCLRGIGYTYRDIAIATKLDHSTIRAIVKKHSANGALPLPPEASSAIRKALATYKADRALAHITDAKLETQSPLANARTFSLLSNAIKDNNESNKSLERVSSSKLLGQLCSPQTSESPRQLSVVDIASVLAILLSPYLTHVTAIS